MCFPTHEEIIAAIDRYTKKVSVSPEAARESLVKAGIYNPDGTLHDNYKPQLTDDEQS